MSPRSLEVRPTYRRHKSWPWVVAAVVLLALGLWELRARRRTAPPVTRPPAHPASIQGQVLTSAGQPAPGVTVLVAPDGVEARSGDDGRFRLEGEEGSRVRLEAHHSDLGFATTEVHAPAMDVQLRLAPRAGIDLQVLAQGTPVPGAVVTVRQRGGEAAVFHADHTTDANGTMRFVGLPGGSLEVEALSPETGARSALQLEAREGAVAQVQLYLPVVGGR